MRTMEVNAPAPTSRAAVVGGRDDELAALARLLEEDGPRIAHVYGIAGIGKSTLLRLFRDGPGANAALVVLMDCRGVEPTPSGFLAALARTAGAEADSRDALLRRLGAAPGPVIVALDTFEVFRLMDTWLRTSLVPCLPGNLRLIIAGRHAPAPAWFAGGLAEQTVTLPLAGLAADAAAALLRRSGLAPRRCAAMAARLHGHPLALQLAASALGAHRDFELAEAPLHRVMDSLTGIHLAEVDDPALRRVIDATAVVRRVSVPLLASMFPDMDADAAYDALKNLPFAEVAGDGLRLHEAVRDAVAQTLRVRDPARHLDYRRRAWRALAREARAAPGTDLWRYTADMLYLVENPVCREAFFPSGASGLNVEHLGAEDVGAVARIARAHEGPEATACLERWLATQPGAFMLARDARQTCVGFCCRFDPDTVPAEHLAADPVTAAWQADLRARPLPAGQRALFIRRWLGLDDGEGPGAVQAATWLDLKRTYMEMRPCLGRVYLTVTDLAPYAAVAEELGFRVLPDSAVTLDGRTYHSAALDFGPKSVDGWLAHLAATELGLTAADDLLDREARELRVDGRRVSLTPLEFALLAYLQANPGRAVSREELLREVWGSGYTGWSNKVDAVVAALRRKLGGHAGCLQTVTGVGYRYRAE
ncbi:transcriptional regulator [Spiribacter halobius]|uniref:Transcriptional regulator n=1 Tax=Sediminicurvatus halobius TaxID=2182432 RepID=A0A2U2N8K6_9GAMM|nr:transcriptional regulator [Spiribacter halobius]